MLQFALFRRFSLTRGTTQRLTYAHAQHRTKIIYLIVGSLSINLSILSNATIVVWLV